VIVGARFFGYFTCPRKKAIEKKGNLIDK